MCVSLLRMKSGEIGLFYGVKYTEGNAIKMRIMMRRSADEGITWSEARLCADEHSYLVLENDRVVRLTTGTAAARISASRRAPPVSITRTMTA